MASLGMDRLFDGHKYTGIIILEIMVMWDFGIIKHGGEINL